MRKHRDEALLTPEGMREAIAEAHDAVWGSGDDPGSLSHWSRYTDLLHELNRRLLAAKVAWWDSPNLDGPLAADICKAERLLHDAFKELEK